MKQISIKLKDEKKLEFELLEKADKGDYINLNSINNIDLSDLKNKINQFKDEEYANKIKQELIQKESEFKLVLDEKMLSSKKTYEDLISKLKDEKAKLENQNIKDKLEIEKSKANQILNLENKIKLSELEYANRLKSESTKIKEEQINEILSSKKTYEDLISKLKDEKAKLENQNIKEKLEIEKSKANQILNLENKIKLSELEYANRLKSESTKIKEEQINEILSSKKTYEDLISKLKDEKAKLENQNIKDKLEIEKSKANQILNLENKIKLSELEYANRLKSESTKIKEEQINEILSSKKTYEDLISKLKDEKAKLENQNIKEKLEIEKSKANQILNLENKIKLSELEYANRLKSESIKIKEEQTNKILKLENEIKFQKNKFESDLNLKEEKFNLEKEKELIDYKNKVKELEEKNNLMLRERQNIKVMGEELESWIENELKKAFGYNDEIKIIRQPIPINGQKPDFLVEIKHKYNNSKIVIEAKTQMNNDGVKKKNIDHLEKLEKYRVRSDSDYAILVSELETNRDFQIYKDSDYPYIFILRPIYLISFLQFTISLLKANQKIHNENINFENKTKIVNEWENYKKTLFVSFEKIEKNVEKIYLEKEKIINSATEIEKLVKITYDSHFNTLKNKIETFNIEKKIVRKIESINEISEVEDLAFKKMNELS